MLSIDGFRAWSRHCHALSVNVNGDRVVDNDAGCDRVSANDVDVWGCVDRYGLAGHIAHRVIDEVVRFRISENQLPIESSGQGRPKAIGDAWSMGIGEDGQRCLRSRS